MLDGHVGFLGKQNALCSGCLLERTSGITRCGRERKGPQATPGELWSWTSLAELSPVGPKDRTLYLHVDQPLDGLPPGRWDPGLGSCLQPKHFLKGLTAEGCPLTTPPEAGVTRPSLREGTWQVYLHAHQPHPS